MSLTRWQAKDQLYKGVRTPGISAPCRVQAIPADKIEAAENTSVRQVIMLALKDAGFTIKDIDMIEDGRRLLGSNKLH